MRLKRKVKIYFKHLSEVDLIDSFAFIGAVVLGVTH